MLTVWTDLTQVANFLFSILSALGTLVMSTILVWSVGTWILGLVIKLFKKITG